MINKINSKNPEQFSQIIKNHLFLTLNEQKPGVAALLTDKQKEMILNWNKIRV